MVNKTKRDSPCYTLKIRGGCETYVKRDGSIGTAGKGPLIQTDVSATLGVTQDQYLFVPLCDPAETLDASYYKGCGMRGGRERMVVAVRVEQEKG